MSEKISIYDSAAVDRLRAELKFEPRRLGARSDALFKKFEGVEAALAELPPDVREEFARRVEFHQFAVEQTLDSQVDGATKLVLRTSAWVFDRSGSDANRHRPRVALHFDPGGLRGCLWFLRHRPDGHRQNLSASEILDQVVLAGEWLGREDRRVRNIVFMGMGEPFHNEETLYEAISALLAPELFHHPRPRHILISTVGIPDAMIRCARRFPHVNLALSLHSVRQKVRERLIPLAARYSLEELRAAVARVNQIQQNSVMIEYLMLAGVNDSAEDARELAAWLAGLDVHVNLIPYNPIESAPDLRTTERPERDVFATILRSAGFTTTIRYSLGADIAAACGQLVQQENREIGRQQAIVSI